MCGRCARRRGRPRAWPSLPGRCWSGTSPATSSSRKGAPLSPRRIADSIAPIPPSPMCRGPATRNCTHPASAGRTFGCSTLPVRAVASVERRSRSWSSSATRRARWPSARTAKPCMRRCSTRATRPRWSTRGSCAAASRTRPPGSTSAPPGTPAAATSPASPARCRRTSPAPRPTGPPTRHCPRDGPCRARARTGSTPRSRR